MSKKGSSSAGVPALTGRHETRAHSELRPNPWNYNAMSDRMMESVMQSIRDNGFCDDVTVREVGPDNEPGFGKVAEAHLQILDGEQRWTAAGRLKLEAVTVRNMGVVSDRQAMAMTPQLNAKGDEPDDLKLAKLVRDLDFSASEAELHLPFSAMELEALASLEDPEWPTIGGGGGGEGQGKGKPMLSLPITAAQKARWQALVLAVDSMEGTDTAIKGRARRLFDLALDLLEKHT